MWEDFDLLFCYIYKGDERAIQLSKQLLTLAHTWDDLIDADKAVSDNDINQAFMLALFDLPANPLWTPLIQHNLYNVYLRWNQANKIETAQSNDNMLSMAWMLRAGLYDLFVLLAATLYGREWAEEIGTVVREYYGETLENYLLEIKNA